MVWTRRRPEFCIYLARTVCSGAQGPTSIRDKPNSNFVSRHPKIQKLKFKTLDLGSIQVFYPNTLDPKKLNPKTLDLDPEPLDPNRIFAEQGWRGLFAGCPERAIYVGLGAAAFFVAYENIMNDGKSVKVQAKALKTQARVLKHQAKR